MLQKKQEFSFPKSWLCQPVIEYYDRVGLFALYDSDVYCKTVFLV